jgi:hypothetical protein
MFLLVLSGCSFGLPTRFPPGPPRCEESPLPIFDTVAAVAAGLLVGFSVLALSASEEGGAVIGAPLLVGSSLLTLTFGASAAHGYRANGACRQAKNAWQNR